MSDADRSRRYRERHPERKEKQRAHALKHYQLNRNAINETRRERESRHRETEKRLSPWQEREAFRTCAARQLDKPQLTWMDQHGRMHREIELTAEELIREWKRKEKQKCPTSAKKKPAPSSRPSTPNTSTPPRPKQSKPGHAG